MILTAFLLLAATPALAQEAPTPAPGTPEGWPKEVAPPMPGDRWALILLDVDVKGGRSDASPPRPIST